MSQKRSFKKLSYVEHVRLRTGMWLGQNSESSFTQHFLVHDKKKGPQFEHREMRDIPAKMKCLDEAVMNAVDEYKKNINDKKIPKAQKMTRLKIRLSKDCKQVDIFDDGRGIPAGNAEGVFMHLMYGENFDDETSRDQVAGQNGVGISLVRIVSDHFFVETYNGPFCYTKQFTFTDAFVSELKKLRYTQADIAELKIWYDEHGNFDEYNAMGESKKKKLTDLAKSHKIIAVKRRNTAKKHGTHVSFQLDSQYFNNLSCAFSMDLVRQYLQDIAMTNPGLLVQFEYNKKTEEFLYKKGLEDLFKEVSTPFYKMTHTNKEDGKQLTWAAFVLPEQNRSLTWVNSNFVSLGGSAIEYLENRICDEVRKKPGIIALEKRLKTSATRNDVRACFHIYNNINLLNPRFKSQDKSYLINDLNEDIRLMVDDHLDRLIRKIDLLNAVKIQLEKRTKLRDLDNAARDLRKANRANIPKLIPATGRGNNVERILFIAEGDSAIAGLRPARTPEKHGLFPLRGKPLNVRGMPLAKAMKNEEIKNIVAIMGLPLNGKVKSVEELGYQKVSIITDADYDGYAIRSLMMSFFYEYWPELYNMGVIHLSNAPLYEVEVQNNQNKKKIYYCIDDSEYENLMKKIDEAGFKMLRKKRNKGLGETSKAAMKYAVDHCLFQIHIKQKAKAHDTQELWFHKDFAEARRQTISAYSQLFFDS